MSASLGLCPVCHLSLESGLHDHVTLLTPRPTPFMPDVHGRVLPLVTEEVTPSISTKLVQLAEQETLIELRVGELRVTIGAFEAADLATDLLMLHRAALWGGMAPSWASVHDEGGET